MRKLIPSIAILIFTLIGCAHQKREILPSNLAQNNFALNESLMRINLESDDTLAPIISCYRGDFAKGLSALKQIPLDRFKENEMNQLATCYLLSKDYKRANFYFKVANATYPNSLSILVNYSVLKSELNEFTQAKSLLERAVTLSPESNIPQYNLAIIYAQNGQLDKASTINMNLLRKASRDPLLWQNQALILLQQGKIESSLQYFKKVPISLWISTDIGLFYTYALAKSKRVEEAKSIWNQISDKSNNRLLNLRKEIEEMIHQGN